MISTYDTIDVILGATLSDNNYKNPPEALEAETTPNINHIHSLNHLL